MVRQLVSSFRDSVLPASRGVARRSRPARRVESAIERLEGRMLLSAATFEHFEPAHFRYLGGGSYGSDVSNDSTEFGLFHLGAEIKAAYFYWQGVDLVDDGGDGIYDNETVTFDGVAVTGISIGVGDTYGRGEGGSQAFRADVTELCRLAPESVHTVTGLRSKAGHHFDKYEFVIVLEGVGPLAVEAVDVLNGNGLTAPNAYGMVVRKAFRTVEPAPAAVPIASELHFTGRQGEPVIGRLSGQMSDGRSIDGIHAIAVPPEVGTLVVDHYRDEFVYTPPKGFTGTVTFQHVMWVGVDSNPATVTIVIESADSSAGDETPSSGETASAVVAPPSQSGNDQRRSDFAQQLGVYVAPRSDEVASLTDRDRKHKPQPVTATVVVYSTEEFDAGDVQRGSLRLGRLDDLYSEGEDFVRPRSQRLVDVDGDGDKDLVAVFELDWTELWDGQEFVELTGRVRGGR